MFRRVYNRTADEGEKVGPGLLLFLPDPKDFVSRAFTCAARSL
jgi:hypothetical protein